MEYPLVAQKSPYPYEAKTGEKKFWCSCGASESQPFCDGSLSRKQTGMKPLRVEFTEEKKVFFCGCKHTKNPPFCDGSHKTLV